MPSRRLALVLLGAALLPAILLCAAVLAVGLKLSSPAQTSVGPIPPTLLQAEEVHIASASGTHLTGWWVPTLQRPDRPTGGIVVLMHGVWENRRRMIERARVLQQNGFAVLLFDFQAHGESPGRHITFGKLEALDAAAAIRFARDHQPGQPIGVIGVSLGGAAALLGPAPLDIDALVLESVYPTIDAALANRLRAGLGPIAGPILTPLIAPIFEVLLPPILGVTPTDLRPIDRVGSVVAPLLVASGTDDDRTPMVETQALFDRAPASKTLWAVSGAGHVDLEHFNPQRYWATILPFLTEHLRGPTAHRTPTAG